MTAVHGHLELRDVEFRYPGAEAPVLHGIDLVARPGEVTAVIGSTGSGKTTLLNLVPRLSDAALREALAQETAEATVVIVAQRVSTIRSADRIVVLEGGRVVGVGTHRELMEENQTYREIVLSQLTEQEAA